jgi:23S rRNA (uracil1939-C5)-methyltransferase
VAGAGALSRKRRAERAERVEIVSLVEDLDHEGRGVAHHEGKAVFIPDALPGERVRWSLAQRHRNFDEARLLEVLEPAASRVTPRCAHFGVCGGCVLQHLDVAKQLEFKQQQLLEALRRIGRVDPPTILEPLTAEPWHYRRRARLAAKWVEKKDRSVVGFRERATPFVADLKRCEVLTEPSGQLIEALSTLISAMSVRDRLPQVEISQGEHTTAMVFRTLKPLNERDVASLRTFAQEHRVEVYLQPGGYETVAPLESSATPLTYRLPEFDVELEFSPIDFVQVNGVLNERMVSRAVEILAPTKDERVLDLFCGLGNFSLPLARRAGSVVALEGEAGLVERARRNAERNGITNVQFIVTNLLEDQSNLPWTRGGFAKVLLDPPRAGAREVLPVVASSGAKRVAYISCHPGSLARDAGILVNEHGFTLAAAGVMDMFPHTAHVESLAVFERD